MSSVQDIYNELFSGKTVVVACRTKNEFESLRTALVKKNSICQALDMTDKSLIGRFNDVDEQAAFHLAVSQKKIRENRWQIVATTEEDSSGQ